MTVLGVRVGGRGRGVKRDEGQRTIAGGGLRDEGWVTTDERWWTREGDEKRRGREYESGRRTEAQGTEGGGGDKEQAPVNTNMNRLTKFQVDLNTSNFIFTNLVTLYLL
jgi:hypothetical protein